MKIHNIKVTNFRSLYGEHYFDFDRLDGLVKLSGPVGAGKTSLGEAIICVLYGKVKDHTNPNMISWGTDTYELEANLTSKGRSIRIVRNPKKQLEVYIDGSLLAATGKNDMQSALEEYYDVPRMVIEKMCIINFNAFSSLAALSPYETKQFLDDIFGFRTFTEYNDEVIIERKEEQTKLTELNAVLTDTINQIKYLEDKKKRQKEAIANSVDIDGLNKNRESLIEQGKEVKSKVDEANRKIEEKRKEFNDEISGVRAKKAEMVTLGRIEKEKYEKFKSGLCPTCGHAIDDSTIASYKANMDDYADKWRTLDAEERRMTTIFNDMVSEMQKEIYSYNLQITEIKKKIADIDNAIYAYKNNLSVIEENYDDLIKSYMTKRDSLSASISSTESEISDWNELNELFSKTLRYKLLDTLIPHINNSIQHYMNKLEQGYRVVYDQEFKAHIYTDNIEGEISYKDLSTGQKKTLDMAIIFGVLQNIISNVEFNVYVVDELFSNMDADLRNIMLSTLKESLENDRTIFVINHAEMADDFFNHKIRVSLKNKRVKLAKSKLKKAVETGSDEIIARASHYEVVY